MGQEQCRCLRETKTEPTTEQSINHQQLQEKMHAARFRINTISKPSSAPRSAPPAPQHSRTKRNISLIFKGMRPDFTVKFDLIEPDLVEKVFQVGSELNVPPSNRTKKHCEDDQFRAIVKYSWSAFGGGAFYIKDDAVGLGCFYRLRHDAKLQLKNNMIISIGNQFMVPSINQNSILTSSQVSDTSQEAGPNQMQINFHGGAIPQGKTVGLSLQNQPRVRIGKGPSCDVSFNDSLLSPIHCTITKEDSRWMLSDGSEYEPSGTGIWVYLSHTTQIYNGMELKCGSTLFTAEIRR